MSVYTVSELAKLSGVSVRTLHHYDEIDLLKPAQVGENGYRYYSREEMLRLQQILFHRELGFTLAEVRRALDAPDFDRRTALMRHRDHLIAEARRYRRLVKTLDETLAALEGETEMNEQAIYRGFPPEKQAVHEAWLLERFGPSVQTEIDASKARFGDMSQSEFDAFQAEMDAVEFAIAKALADGLPANGEVAGAIVRRHHAWIGRSWRRAPDGLGYRNLAAMYSDHPEFHAHYERRAKGLTEYLVRAMNAFAERELD